MDKTTIDAYNEGKALMNRAGKNLGTMHKGGTEDRRFRSTFGCSAEVCITAWNKMIQLGLLPEGDTPSASFNHYLWALAFLKLYPENETTMCSILGGIDAKTMRKWVWPYIGSMFELKYDVVSNILYMFMYTYTRCDAMCTICVVAYSYNSRFVLKTERMGTLGKIVCYRMMASTFLCKCRGSSSLIQSSLAKVDIVHLGMKLVYASKLGISAGTMDLLSQVCTMII